MATHKRINRNPFNEKLIHRYLLELFYGIPRPDRDAIRRLLPEEFHHSSINVVVPEAHLPKQGYRPDLTLFFRRKQEGVPLEVKWAAASLPEHQRKYLSTRCGILVSLDRLDQLKQSNLGVHCAQIDWEHFRDWFARSSLRLLRDAFPTTTSPNTWIVVLRGDHARENFDRMLEKGSRGAFWAFKNNPTSIRYVLELAKNDNILFLFVSTSAAGKGRSREGNKLMLDAATRMISVVDWYQGVITDPYYMALEGTRSTFFERGNPAINDRYWPHFISFNVVAQCRSTPSEFVRGYFAGPFAESANQGGIPVRLTPAHWDELRSILLSSEGQGENIPPRLESGGRDGRATSPR
ncbi:MAG TPA: hypothetical protein VEY88_15915 [Archangium sp.]|nr:hypothetical protein [Archangium sp.]